MKLCCSSPTNAVLVKWICFGTFLMFLLVSNEVASISDQEHVHLLMTREERRAVFGSDTRIPDYQLVEFSKKSQSRQRRHLNSDFEDVEDQITLSISTKDRILHLHLERQQYLASPEMKVEILDEGGRSETIFVKHPQCYYRGIVDSMENSAVAISTCTSGEIKGIIHLTPDDRYILAPLPMRLRRDTSVSEESKISNKHVFYKHNEESKCAVDHSQQSALGNVESDFEEIEPRPKRQTEGPKTVETAVVLDDVMYSLAKANYPSDPVETLIDTVFTMMNCVQLMYDRPSLSVKIKIVLVHLKIIKSASVGPSKENGDIMQYIRTFSEWQYTRNPQGDHNEDHWDHALMISGLDLYSDKPEDNSVIGLAWVGRMCDPYYSSTVNEGSNFGASYVIAHEMGHNLGMNHDGQRNDCPSTKYVMSPSTGAGKTSWSECSAKSLLTFLRRRLSRCLDDEVEPQPHMDYRSDLLPGEKYTISEQCQRALGKEYRAYISNKPPANDVCALLYCYKGQFAEGIHPALDGTKCGFKKSCFQGKCTDVVEIKKKLGSNP